MPGRTGPPEGHQLGTVPWSEAPVLSTVVKMLLFCSAVAWVLVTSRSWTQTLTLG